MSLHNAYWLLKWTVQTKRKKDFYVLLILTTRWRSNLKIVITGQFLWKIEFRKFEVSTKTSQITKDFGFETLKSWNPNSENLGHQIVSGTNSKPLPKVLIFLFSKLSYSNSAYYGHLIPGKSGMSLSQMSFPLINP
jgi:hypothetical protein